MRYWEIDFARGAAVIAMVVFNWSFALQYLGVYNLTGSWLFWQILPRIIGGAFIFIAGISLWLSYSRNASAGRHLLRGSKIFLIGVGITAATWLAFPSDFIIFGILHLIGLSVIVGCFLVKLSAKALAALSAVIIATGVLLQTQTFTFPYLLWLGFIPAGFTTFDYFPVAPWLGVFVAGIAFGKKFYAKRSSGSKRGVACLEFLGRHSLAIYIIHQPLLLAALFSMGLL